MGDLKAVLSRLTSDYGMLLVLLLLCAFFSAVTFKEQKVRGAQAAENVADLILGELEPGARLAIVARWNQEDVEFARTLEGLLKDAGFEVVATVTGHPHEAREALEPLLKAGERLDGVALNHATSRWLLFDALAEEYSSFRSVRRFAPETHYWPDFLKARNILNVANQIVVIAIIAIGMTMVIITGGIDLSVGSLIALSAVVTTWLIREAAGAENASAAGMTLACLGGIALSGVIGFFSGSMVTFFSIPPFIVTLAMMQVASGLAYIIARGQSIYQVPDGFIWLGRGSELFGIPNAVVLMALLYAGAHIVMSRMVLGRHIYAVGGNREAARLSGVPVRRVLLVVYTVCGLLAGLGGVVMASQLKSGSPTYGETYELFVIAAVVVGGTSLAGGEGKILGTLIGALIIAVINNGMNLTGVESYTQKVVLGLVILAAVLIDMLKRGGLPLLRSILPRLPVFGRTTSSS